MRLVFITLAGGLTSASSCFVDNFSHFHLDHCGALPYMSEMVGFKGPIYMTTPTKAICPILLVIQYLAYAISHHNTSYGIVLPVDPRDHC